jgi:phosphoglycolate phosphatase
MIGDREHDIIGAKQNGMQSIGACWGYGNVKELQKAGATALAENPEALLDVLLP